MVSRISLMLLMVGVCAPTTTAAPTFYLTTDPNGGAVSDLNLMVPLNSTGTMYLAVDTDVRLSQVELDVASLNPYFLQLGGAYVVTEGRYVTFYQTTGDISGSEIHNIGGVAIPALPVIGGTGIGPGSGVANPTVIAAITYRTGSDPGYAPLVLRIGQNGIWDWNNRWTDVLFGTSTDLVHNINGGGGLSTLVGFAQDIAAPEPRSASLVCFAAIGAFGAFRHRR